MAADDPHRRFLENRFVRGEQSGNKLGVETSAIHLVERDHGRAHRSRILAIQSDFRLLGIADLDQGISERMFERAIDGLACRLQQRGDRVVVADPPQRLGRGPTVMQ